MNYLFKFFIYLFVFIIFFLIAEFLSKYAIKYDGGAKESKLWYEYRLQKIDAYDNKPYDIKLLIKNYFKLQHSYVDDIFVPLDLKSKYINVINNKRKTEFQPENYINTVYLFGASTIFCAEVPDKYTIASHLQKNLNKENVKSYKVENLGVSGLRITDQVNRINKIKFKENDILIFYDRSNEVYQYLYRDSFKESIIEQDRKFKEKLNIFTNLYLSFYDKYGANYSFLFRRFLNPYKVPRSYEKEFTTNDIRGYHEIYIENLKLIKLFAKKNNLKYFHIFQPTIFNKKNKFSYESDLINNLWLTPNGLDNAFNFEELSYMEIKKKLDKEKINSTSFSNIFNNTNEKIYLDYSHVNELGNEIIASEINKLLKSEELIN